MDWENGPGTVFVGTGEYKQEDKKKWLRPLEN
jgi:hypothetical protein